MSVNALSGKILLKQRRYPINRTSASAHSHTQPVDEHNAYSGYIWLQDGRSERRRRRRSEYTTPSL